MRYGQIRRYDIANGVGIRTSVFVTGCTRHCPNCFNVEYQDFNAGNEWTQKETDLLIKYLQDPNIEGLSILGGEPMQNAEGLVDIIHEVKKKVNKTIWVWSGYLFEEIVKDPVKFKLLSECDILVDGPFVDALKDPALWFRGSSNQRVIDIKKSLEEGKVVETYDHL